MTNPLFLHVTTVLYAEGSDPQILDAQALPSRVVAATPAGPLLQLMALVGREVEVSASGARPTREEALAGLRRFLERELGAKAQGFDLVESGADEIPRIPRGNTYISPFGPDLGPEGDFAFGFPVGRRELLQDSTRQEGERAFDAVLKNPPLADQEGPRIWARYHVILSNVPPLDPTTVPIEQVRAAEERARAESASASHARDQHLIDDDGVLSLVRGIFAAKDGGRSDLDAEGHAGEMRFVRMFPVDPKEVRARAQEAPRTASFDRLARAMMESPSSREQTTTLPAGYAFLGQFLTHELSRGEQGPLAMQRGGLPQQQASVLLDGASFYGGGPEASPQLYAEDGISMKLGQTVVESELDTPRALDLPRLVGSASANIADPRNDSNLAVAQVHVAVLRFHNAVVAQLREQGVAAAELFAQAQAEVLRSLQAVVWHDFASRIARAADYADAQARTAGGYTPRDWRPASGDPGMPLEFSVAAFRIGHSLIAEEYDWNEAHCAGSDYGRAQMHDLFRMSGALGMGGQTGLPDDWALDWRRFVPAPQGVNSVMWPEAQHARPIDPYASAAMHHLPPQIAALGSLPKLNLMRGDRVGLPDGEVVAQAMGLGGEHLPAPASGGCPVDAVLASEFAGRTPLWLYILREAQLHEGGQTLGQVGSRIVLDTLGVLLDRSPHSIFHSPDWQPCWTRTPAAELQWGDLLHAAGVLGA